MSSINVYCVEVSNTNMEKLQEIQKSQSFSSIAELSDVHFVGSAESTVADVLAHIEKNVNPPTTTADADAEAVQVESKPINMFAIRPNHTDGNLLLLQSKTPLASVVTDEFMCYGGDSEGAVSIVLLYSTDAELGDNAQSCCLVACCAACCACITGILCCCCDSDDDDYDGGYGGGSGAGEAGGATAGGAGAGGVGVGGAGADDDICCDDCCVMGDVYNYN